MPISCLQCLKYLLNIYFYCIIFECKYIYRELKEKRKKYQEMNKKAKEDSKKAQRQKFLKEANEKVAEDDDKEYYRQEVGEEPDTGT